MKNVTYVTELPACDFCKEIGLSGEARYDAKTLLGPWAFVCKRHFEQETLGQLGVGKGTELKVDHNA